MKLFGVIDYLFIGTRFGCWGLGILGIVVSVVLAIVNIPMGVGSALIFIAALLLSMAIALLLAPKGFFSKKLSETKRIAFSVGSVAAAMLLAGGVYWLTGGFPALNLLVI